MQRIFDITACLFSPPVSSSDTEIQLFWNEKLEHSLGDVDENRKFSEKVSKFLRQDSKFTTVSVEGTEGPLDTDHENNSTFIQRKEAISRERSIANAPAESTPL